MLLAGPPIQLHGTDVGGSSGQHGYKRETPLQDALGGMYHNHVVCAILWHTRLNSSTDVGAMFLNLRMLSKKRTPVAHEEQQR